MKCKVPNVRTVFLRSFSFLFFLFLFLSFFLGGGGGGGLISGGNLTFKKWLGWTISTVLKH